MYFNQENYIKNNLYCAEFYAINIDDVILFRSKTYSMKCSLDMTKLGTS